jgi:uncharacterized protein (TIGR03382 family)
MKKTWLYPCLSAISVCALTTVAHADPIPGILYIPTEEVELLASGTGGDPECMGTAYSRHSGLGCYPGGGTFSAFTGAEGLADDMRGALEDYAVTITHERLPKWVPFMMLLPGESDDDSLSFSCTATGSSDCLSTITRRRIARVMDGTENCTNPDLLHAALFAFGRMSGLDPIDNPADPMGYDNATTEPAPLDWENPSHEFQNSCSTRVSELGFTERGEVTTVNSPCTQLDYVDCDPTDQNSHANLIEVYGEAADERDEEAPVIAITFPEDGAELAHDEAIVIEASVEDDADHVAAHWLLEGAGLEDLIEVDHWEFCTNQACRPTEGLLAGAGDDNWHWSDGLRWKPTESSFAMPSISGLPPGEYTATFQAADPYGNVADAVSVTFTVAEPPPGSDDTGGDDNGSAGDSDPSAGDSFTGPDDGGTGDGPATTTAGGEDDGGGCSCTSGGPAGGIAAFGLMLGLAGLRRRRR